METNKDALPQNIIIAEIRDFRETNERNASSTTVEDVRRATEGRISRMEGGVTHSFRPASVLQAAFAKPDRQQVCSKKVIVTEWGGVFRFGLK